MKAVASCDHYVIEVDEIKNRIIFAMKGAWTDANAVPDWLEDMRKALKYVKRGFTELIDWTDVSAIVLTDYIAAAQQLAIDAGLRKAARVYSGEKFLKIQMDTLSKKTSFPVESFFTREEAETWLDQS